MSIEAMRPVVVGVDGSPTSTCALDLAAEEAAGRVAPLLVLHAQEQFGHLMAPAGAGDGAGNRPDVMARRRRLVDVAVARARAEHPCLAVSSRLLTGVPAEVLAEASRRAALLVIGHGGRSGTHALPVGSVAARIVRHAACPVIVYRSFDREHPPANGRPVLAAVNAPVRSRRVLQFAFDEAAERGVALVVSYVWSQPPGARPAGIRPDTYDYRRSRDEAERMLSEALAGLSARYPDVPVRQDVRHSLDVAGTLIDASAEAQLVIVGRHERSSLSDLLLGSVSQALIEKARCPVAVVGG